MLCSFPHIQAIHGYRETERVSWGAECQEVLNRVRSTAFPADSSLLGPVHVLDLDKKGYIKPHVDSVKVGLPFHPYVIPPHLRTTCLSSPPISSIIPTTAAFTEIFSVPSVLWHHHCWAQSPL